MDGIGKYMAAKDLPAFSVKIQRQTRHGAFGGIYFEATRFAGIFYPKSHWVDSERIFKNKS